MKFKLIMSLVRPELTNDVVKAAKSAGATGDVIIPARGSGLTEARIFGIVLDDKTDVVLFVVEEHSVNKILDALCTECRLTDPGRGIAFVLSIDKVTGMDKQIAKIKEKLKEERL
ncbi:MAG: P-II family nitrogen regulator [Saprospiraceae bacterium]|jgi:nitrogen regulatory protein P-II 1|nr:P-II family nitrogen regulator [Saprospiraceae bacterium]